MAGRKPAAPTTLFLPAGRGSLNHDEITQLPSERRLLTPIVLAPIVGPLAGGLAPFGLAPIPRDLNRQVFGFLLEFLKTPNRAAAHDELNGDRGSLRHRSSYRLPANGS